MLSSFEPPLSTAEATPLFPHLKSLECLKPGSEGAVFQAFDSVLAREVLLKIYGPDRQHRRTELEIAKLKSINSPYLVTLFDSGIKEIRGLSCYYITTNFIEGTNLQSVYESGTKLSEQEAVKLIECISQAIEALWAVEVVHCDIKPENIIRRNNGDYVLIDLGVAKHLDAETLTQQGVIFGSRGYLAPEQFRGRKNLTLRADLYALGIVAYQCLIGYHPFGFRQEVMMVSPLPPFPSQANISISLQKAIFRLSEPVAFRRAKSWAEISAILKEGD